MIELEQKAGGSIYEALPFDEVRTLYRAHLESQGFSKNTISTAYSDSFYLWKKGGKEVFWSVLRSIDFETEAKAALRSALQTNSRGNVDALLGGYMAHLRRFRRFAYSAAPNFEEQAQSVIPPKTTRSTNPDTSGVPSPSVEQVKYYLQRWDELENYHLQENALNKLFHQFCPENKTIEDILLKAATLNDFYSTNIYSIYPVAKHILALNIDDRLAKGWEGLVDEIQTVVIGGKEKHFYSFATKYCSHHNEKDYPIYDSYVDEVLRYFRTRDRFARFYNEELKVYARFKELLITFRTFYGLDQFSLKEVDKYLWQLGKDYFPKSYRRQHYTG